jgi:hypothetical protein
MQPKITVQFQVDTEKDIIVCKCGGIGLLFNVAFLPKHNIAAIGAKPEIIAAPILICNTCGQRIKEPFTRVGDVKEAT